VNPASAPRAIQPLMHFHQGKYSRAARERSPSCCSAWSFVGPIQGHAIGRRHHLIWLPSTAFPPSASSCHFRGQGRLCERLSPPAVGLGALDAMRHRRGAGRAWVAYRRRSSHCSPGNSIMPSSGFMEKISYSFYLLHPLGAVEARTWGHLGTVEAIRFICPSA